jgi:hypothetical protein
MAQFVFSLVQTVHRGGARLLFIWTSAGAFLTLGMFMVYGLQDGFLLTLPALPVFLVAALVVLVSSRLLLPSVPEALKPKKWADYTKDDWMEIGILNQVVTLAQLLVGFLACVGIGWGLALVVWTVGRHVW